MAREARRWVLAAPRCRPLGGLESGPAGGGFRGVESGLSMPHVLDSGHPPAALSAPGNVRKRPVILATLSVRVDPNAERVALESALETGTSLIVANMLPLQAYPLTS